MVFIVVSSIPLLLIGVLTAGGGVEFSVFSLLITRFGGVLAAGGHVLWGRPRLLFCAEFDVPSSLEPGLSELGLLDADGVLSLSISRKKRFLGDTTVSGLGGVLVLKFFSNKLCTMASRGRFVLFSFLIVVTSISSSLISTNESGRRFLTPRQNRRLRFGRQKNNAISLEIPRLGVVCFQEWSRCHGDDCIELLSSETLSDVLLSCLYAGVADAVPWGGQNVFLGTDTHDTLSPSLALSNSRINFPSLKNLRRPP